MIDNGDTRLNLELVAKWHTKCSDEFWRKYGGISIVRSIIVVESLHITVEIGCNNTAYKNNRARRIGPSGSKCYCT